MLNIWNFALDLSICKKQEIPAFCGREWLPRAGCVFVGTFWVNGRRMGGGCRDEAVDGEAAWPLPLTQWLLPGSLYWPRIGLTGPAG